MKSKLIITGNGFDLWQGLNTSYAEFEKFYYANRDRVMKSLFIRRHKIKFGDGHVEKAGDVELIYGDPLDPGELEHSFWSSFEESLDAVEDERINLFFGKHRRGLRRLSKSVKNAKRILTELFIRWVRTIEIEKIEAPYQFDGACTFLNFNYTDTLQRRFRIPYEDMHYIHGEAADKKSIIFGHSSRPEPPAAFFHRLGGRFRGLYHIELMLYETDKHVDENIAIYALFLSLQGINPEDIKEVYVLGHSFGKVDYGYFEFLVKATQKTAKWHISCFNDEDKSRAEELMASLNFSNYEIYSTIDDCIKEFRVVTPS